MSYQLLNSDNVQVFPFGKVRHHDPNARVLNEQNITNLVRMLTDRKSYVVSYDDSDPNRKLIEFVINGYFFKTDVSELWELFTENKDVYAYIDLATTDDEYSYLKGGDRISTIVGGSGSSEDPFLLNEGRFTTVMERKEITDQDTYFKYTFSADGAITIYDNDDLIISGIPEDHISKDNKIIIQGTEGRVVEFCISLAINSSQGNVCIDLLYANKFDGIKFVFEKPEEKFYLKLFEETTAGINVPVDSFLKFEQSSIGNPFESIDFIACGTAAEFIEE